MIIYQDLGYHYKSDEHHKSVSINKRNLKRATAKKPSLNTGNRKFLKNLGLKVKK